MKRFNYFLIFMLFGVGIISTQAQPTYFKVRIENVGQAFPFSQSGVFNTPVDSVNPGPLFPGAAYEFSFDAAPGSYLSLATMMVQSNDLFYAPDESGIALYDAMGIPITGDVTNQLMLWDAGTEANEAPGEGPNQAPRQMGPNMGAADPDTTVRIVNDGYTYPADSAIIKLTLTHNGGTSFTARIENVSTPMTLMISGGMTVPVPLAPGIFVVHSNSAPLFTSGEADRGEGLEGIAEDGNPSQAGTSADTKTGITGVMAPGIFAVHGMGEPFFTDGMPDRGQGLEAIAEDGSPGMLARMLRDAPGMTTGVFAVPVGKSGPGPLLPGEAYEFTIASGPTGKLSFATMFVQSNDLVYSPDAGGIPLFDAGMPISGDITDKIDLWDVGTELNEIPGIGINQAPRQSGPNMGMADTNMMVRLVNDGYIYPADEDIIQVTITPLQSKKFVVRIENVSTPESLMTDSTNSVAVPLAPGQWLLHSTPGPLFTSGEKDRGLGLEAIAEDGDPSMLNTSLSMKMGTPRGIFNTPVDSAGPGPLFPGAAYEFSFFAAPGIYLSLATMFVQSNDLFYAPNEMGIPLFDGAGMPIYGDITGHFDLWDAGTEENEQPGVGMNQAPRQSGPNTGSMDMDSTVRIVSDTYTYPEDSTIIRVTIMDNFTSIDPLTPDNSPLAELISFPNPFTDETTIRIHLEERLSLGLEVYNLMGQKVIELMPMTDLNQGIHEYIWKGNSAAGNKVKPGIYIVRLNTGNGGVSSLLLVRQ